MASGNLIDVGNPTLVAASSIGGQANQLDASLGELGLQLGEGAELGGAYWGKIFRVREEDDPAITNELMEVNRAFGGFGLEVGGSRAQAKTTPACELRRPVTV